MLCVKLELWPGGDEKTSREIGRVLIWNLSDLAPVSNYGYQLQTHDGGDVITGEVLRHERRKGAWKLLARVLKAALLGNS